MKIFFKQIENIKLVSEFKLREDSNNKDSYIFNYRDVTFTALQITKPDLTLSRISLGLNAEGLLNKVGIEPYRVCRRPLFLRECPDEKSKIHP